MVDGALLDEALRYLAYLASQGEDDQVRTTVLELALDPDSWGRTNLPLRRVTVDLTERDAWSRSTS